MDMDSIMIISKLWPIFVAFILLIVTLAQAHYRIKVLEEKVKVAFELINKITDKKYIMNQLLINIDVSLLNQKKL